MITDTQSTSNIKPKEKSYAVCPECHSVNLKILHEDEDVVHIICLECKHQFWKTKI